MRSKGYLYVGVTFAASTEQFESSIFSNFAFSAEFCEPYSEYAETSLSVQGSIPGISGFEALNCHLALLLFHPPVTRLALPEVLGDLAVELSCFRYAELTK